MVAYALIAGGLTRFRSRSAALAIWHRVRVGIGGGVWNSCGAWQGIGHVVGLCAVSRVQSFAWPGLASLHRPNNRTVLLMLTLGLGTFLILTLYLLQTSHVREILPGARQDQPDAFYSIST